MSAKPEKVKLYQELVKTPPDKWTDNEIDLAKLLKRDPDCKCLFCPAELTEAKCQSTS